MNYAFELECLHNTLAERVFRQLKDRVNLDYTFGFPYDEKGEVLRLMINILLYLRRSGKSHNKKAVLKEFAKFSSTFQKTLNKIDKVTVIK